MNLVKRVEVKENEIVKVILAEGAVVIGVVDKIEENFFWLRKSPDPNSKKFKLDFKIDQIIKLN